MKFGGVLPLRNQPYLGLSGGWQTRETVHEADNPATSLEFHDGYALNAALGYRHGRFRFEAEFSWFNNGIDTASAGIPGLGRIQSSAVGDVNLRAFMFNAYHDIPIQNTPVKLYFGAGIGAYQSEINGLLPAFFANLGLPTTGINATSDFAFAYQFRVGITYACSEDMEFQIGWRYFHGEKLTFSAVPFGTFHPDGANINSVEVGVHFNF